MRKTIFALILMFSLLLALTACGGDKTPATENPGNSDSPVTTDEPSSEAADPNAPITGEMVRNHATTPTSEFEYDVVDDGIRIKGYTGSDVIVVVPDEIDGKAVTSFSKLVFGNSSPVRGVMIPKTVKSLDELCANNRVIEVVICEGVEKVEYMALAACDSLREVHFGEAISDIQEKAFLLSDQVTIYAPAGSYAETFANENNIPFKAE